MTRGLALQAAAGARLPRQATANKMPEKINQPMLPLHALIPCHLTSRLVAPFSKVCIKKIKKHVSSPLLVMPREDTRQTGGEKKIQYHQFRP
ncbi:hypothetical protein BaRGS_00001066 [Batillaria attramentaria]|uniref:Uncharacterized protein n=1 Tax=Batillaria attramentaria TaxID=370345 RepID=A0ABD0M646_9CAEN